MTRVLFLPTPDMLLWLDEDLPAEVLLEKIRSGDWQPPAPFALDPSGGFTAACQDGVVTITLTGLRLASTPAIRLNRRLREVLKGVAENLTTRQIAHRLRISRRMVAYHVAELKHIFSAGSRAELMAKYEELSSRGEELDAD
ncbi:MAG TPA: LuxR C-terminal-related transcriptional regulator [Anaerolinea sp.]|nr:LuxR C-terminal-related transcriptional regulator [Anaerolinea sp.]